jgi:hypothetical protein
MYYSNLVRDNLKPWIDDSRGKYENDSRYGAGLTLLRSTLFLYEFCSCCEMNGRKQGITKSSRSHV